MPDDEPEKCGEYQFSAWFGSKSFDLHFTLQDKLRSGSAIWFKSEVGRKHKQRVGGAFYEATTTTRNNILLVDISTIFVSNNSASWLLILLPKLFFILLNKPLRATEGFVSRTLAKSPMTLL
jgi:hypothetical protein